MAAAGVPLLTLEERVRVRHHTGYLNVSDVQSFALGLPAAVQTQFIIEGSMDKVIPESLPLLRKLIGTLDQIETQMVDDLELLAVTSIGSINIQANEQKMLVKAYLHWRDALCNLLGCIANPYDARFMNAGVNASVSHGL